MAIEYGILQSDRADDLESQVAGLIKQGWEPLGGIAGGAFSEQYFSHDAGEMRLQTAYLFSQAMIKKS